MKIYPVIKPPSTLPTNAKERIFRLAALILAFLSTYALFVKILFF